MENVNTTDLSQWVRKCAATVAPPADWEPSVDLARTRIKSRLSPRPATRRYWLAGAATACAISAGFVLEPSTRALAQQLWQWITVGRIEVVRVDFDSLPDEAKSLSVRPIHRPGPPLMVADSNEA